VLWTSSRFERGQSRSEIIWFFGPSAVQWADVDEHVA